jgi:hypothetical protein
MATHKELKAQRRFEGELRNRLFASVIKDKPIEIVLPSKQAEERSSLLGEGIRRREYVYSFSLGKGC